VERRNTQHATHEPDKARPGDRLSGTDRRRPASTSGDWHLTTGYRLTGRPPSG